MYRLIITVKRGSATSIAGAWLPYATIEAARVAGAAVLREERVQKVMIVRDNGPGTFVEWLDK